MSDPKPDDIQSHLPKPNIESQPPEKAPDEIQAHAPAHFNDDPPLPEYDFRKHSFWELVGSTIQRRRVPLTLMLLLVVVVVVVHRLYFPPDPPLTAEVARQALIVFAASGEPLLSECPVTERAVPVQMTVDESNGTVTCGKYVCSLHQRRFDLIYRHSPLGIFDGGIRGRFVLEHGVWKAKIGGPPDGRFQNWAG